MPRVLLVDDDLDLLAALQAFLEAHLEVEVLAAGSGAEALEAMQSTPVDVVVSDFRMPLMDGLQFLGQACQRHPEVPRLLLTAFPDLRLAVEALNQASIRQFLTKPVQPERLVQVIEGVLTERRRDRQHEAAFERAAHATGRSAAPRRE